MTDELDQNLSLLTQMVAEVAATNSGKSEGFAGDPPRDGQARLLGRGQKAIENGAILSIPVKIEIIIGTARLPLSRLMTLTQGDVVVLDRKLGEPVEVAVNGRVIARGEIVVTGEQEKRYGIAITHVGLDDKITAGGSDDSQLGSSEPTRSEWRQAK